LFLEISVFYFSLKFVFLSTFALGVLELRVRLDFLARALVGLPEGAFVLVFAIFLVGRFLLREGRGDEDGILAAAEFLMVASEFFRNHFVTDLAVVVLHLVKVGLYVDGRVDKHICLPMALPACSLLSELRPASGR
jgi:hypothetical protein